MQNSTPLYDAMKALIKKNVTPFDVPGHKRGKGVPELIEFIGKRAVSFDVNSMPPLDNLNYPEGVIDEAQALLASAYNADYAFFVVNGTTLAVHSMILSVCRPKEKILLPRNVHKSAINALILCDAHPVYIQPEIEENLKFATGVTFESAKKAIDQNPDAKAIFLINPTYYGICSDIEKIAEYAHSKNMAVIVDEAHGAHFNFHPELPKSAIECGADMVAVSIHKTGGALTQASAVLLSGNRISKDYVKSILNIFHTTSASYLLMTSLDIARKNLALNGEKILTDILKCVRKYRKKINKLKGFYCYGNELVSKSGIYSFDETKLGINVEKLGLTGFELYDILLLDYNIQMELADAYNVLAIISLGDCESSLKKLYNALLDISQKYSGTNDINVGKIPLENPRVLITPRDAFYGNKKYVKLDEAEGRIIAESVMIYPPGIPILAPGEVITKEVIDYLKFLKTQHLKLTDMSDKKLESLLIVDNSY